MRFVIFIIHQGLKNIQTFSSRPRPRPRLFLQDQDQDQDFYFKTKIKIKIKTKTIFMSSGRLETKTKVSRLHPWYRADSDWQKQAKSTYHNAPDLWSPPGSNYLLLPSSFSTPSLGAAAPVPCPVLALNNNMPDNKTTKLPNYQTNNGWHT